MEHVKQPKDRTRRDRPIARWIVAVIAVTYGFAKLNGSQFTVLDSVLDQPMGSVSGFWLTWYYFSYSPFYGNLIALAQVVGGLLVTQRRFAVIGALGLLPVAANILLVDIFFGIGVGPTIVALVLLGLLVWIVAPHVGRIVRAVLPSRVESLPGRGRFVAPLVLVLFAVGLTYWTANYNNRAPTAVDGVWEVDSPDGRAAFERVFFERNRAHMVVFKDTAGTFRQRHFEVDADGRLRVWEQGQRRGSLLYEGQFTPPDRIRLRGVTGRLDLHRRAR